MALAPITYREFHDVPRIFVVEANGRLLLFDCPFDNDLDDYPAFYKVYELDAVQRPRLANPDWRGLVALGIPLGETPVSHVIFDDTRRAWVETDSLGWDKV